MFVALLFHLLVGMAAFSYLEDERPSTRALVYTGAVGIITLMAALRPLGIDKDSLQYYSYYLGQFDDIVEPSFILISDIVRATLDDVRGIFIVYALLAIVLGWTVFRAKDLGTAVSYIGAMLGMAPGGIADATFAYYLTNSFSVFAAAVLLSLPIVPYLQRKAAFQRVGPVLATGIFVLSLVLTVSSSYNPFIYFNF